MSNPIDDLARADHQVTLAERHVSAQQEVVALMRSAGASTEGAEKLLEQFEAMARRHRAARDLAAYRVEGEFAEAA